MKRHLNALGCLIIGAVGMVFSSAAFSARVNSALPPNTRLQEVARITNTRDASVAFLSVAIDPQDVVIGVYSVCEKNDGSGEVTRNLMPISEIQSAQGSVLLEENGVKITILQGIVDSEHGAARLQISFMTNGITHSYSSCRLNAFRSAQGTWSLVNAYNGKIITEARAKTWALGIKTIENVCPAN